MSGVLQLPKCIISVHFHDLSVRVYTDLQQVRQNLSHPRFEFTDLEQEADILYIFSHFKDYRLHSYFPASNNYFYLFSICIFD